MQIWLLYWTKFSNKSGKSFAQSSTSTNKTIFQKRVSSQVFLWTRKMQIWIGQKHPAMSPKTLRSNLKQELPIRFFLWTHRMQILLLYRTNFSQMCGESFAQKTYSIEKFFYPHTNFFSNVPLDTQTAASTTLSKNFCQKSENFSFEFRKCWKNMSFTSIDSPH